MEKKIIELKNISKNFEDQQVLKGIDLNIYENEFLTLLGPSGCGKTTLLRIIGGFEEPSNGQLIFDGKDISKVPPYKREVNTVFQKYALFPFLNVADNIAFGLNLKKMDKDVIEKKVSRMLELVGLKGFEKRDVTLLSGGQQQRVAIARALVNEPKVLLLDEPLGALDAKLRKDMQTELKKIQKEVGITFIFVTHDQEEALSMSDTIVVLNDGVIQQIGTPMDEDLLCAPHAKAQEVGKLGNIDLRLEHGLGLAKHRGGVQHLAVRAGDHIGGLQENGGAVLPGHCFPIRLRGEGGVDGHLELFLAGHVALGDDMLMIVRHRHFDRAVGPDLLAADDQGNLNDLGGLLCKLGFQLGALGAAGKIALKGIVCGFGNGEICVRHNDPSFCIL